MVLRAKGDKGCRQGETAGEFRYAGCLAYYDCFSVCDVMQEYLRPTETINSDHPTVIAFAGEHCSPNALPIDNAIELYYAVRDQFRYDPYRLDLSVSGMQASHTIDLGYGWCVSKAILLAALCRAAEIPSRLGFADVRNHLSTRRLRETMGTDIFHWHGYVSLYLDGKWVKATPAFNRELCEKLNIGTLEFNGREDSLYHPFDLTGKQHMEYLRDRGEHADLPLDQLSRGLHQYYPNLMSAAKADFAADVARETRRN